MPAIDDIIQITHNQSMLGQRVTNIYHYIVNTSDRERMFGSEIPIFLLDWETQWAQNIAPLLSEQLVSESIIYDNLMNPDEYGIAEGTKTGTTTGEPYSTVAALGFRLLTSRRTVRSGAKRYAGLVEGSVNGNTINFTTVLVEAAIDWLTTSMQIQTDVDTAADYIIDPVVVGRTKGADGKYFLDTSRFAFINGAEVSNLVTSQVSRKARQT